MIKIQINPIKVFKSLSSGNVCAWKLTRHHFPILKCTFTAISRR